MSKTEFINVRVDPKLKNKASIIAENNHLNLSDTIRIFLNYIVTKGSLPVDIFANKEQYELWFKETVEEALKSPISEISHEEFVNKYKQKYNV